MMKTRAVMREKTRLLLLVALMLAGGLVAGATPAMGQSGASNGQRGGETLERLVALDLTDVTLSDALNRIRQNTGIGLIYSPDLLPAERKVSCPCRESSVGEALEMILRGTDLTFSASGTQIRIVPRPRPPQGPPAGSIAGTVQNGSDGSPIPNALVQLSDGRGSLTNENGHFILLNVPPGVYSLTVTGLGWDSREVEGIVVEEGGTATVEVFLTQRAIPLSELVIAPGTFGILDEVSDYAQQTLTREQIETFPQLGEDVFRSLQRLPGIASGDISTKLHLRGGYDREVLYVLDGMELYEPYHLKEFEGTLGVIDVQAIGAIDLHTGGFPVDYGDRMGGVFGMETRRPPEEGMRTTLGLSITNASFMSRGAFDHGRGQWLFSARRGYLDIALSLTDVDNGISPRYYDVLGKVEYQLGSKHLVSAHVLHAGDRLELDQDVLRNTAIGELGNGWGNTYGWLTWKAFLSSRVRAWTLLSGGRISRSRSGFQEELGRIEGPEAALVSDEGSFDFLGLKHEWTVDFTDRLAGRVGVSWKGLDANFDYLHWARSLVADGLGEREGQTDTVLVRLTPSGTETGAFIAARFRPVSRVTGEVGVRYDRHSYTGDSDVSPRAHAVIDVTENTTLRAGWGRYHQSQGMNELEVANGETEFAPSEGATQIALGIEHRLENGVRARVEAYTRAIDRPRREYLNLWREILAFPELEGDRVRVDPTEARAKGIELLLSHDGPVWDWSGSYVLATAEDRIQDAWVPRFMDQRHAFTLTVGFHPSSKWTLSGAWHIHSGWPYTPQIIRFDTLTVFRGEGENWPLNWKQEFGPMNSDRLPAYHRLDLRATRRFELRRGVLDVYVDLFNAYNQVNLRSWDYNLRWIDNRSMFVREPDEELLPILPSIGFRWEF
jgi:outer membrane receptor protein involved in Fe transport